MLGTYTYNEIFRKSVIAFGTLFNNIRIKKFGTDGKTISQLKVPIAYGPMQRFLARIEQQPNFDDNVAISLPRISFELIFRGDKSPAKSILVTIPVAPVVPRPTFKRNLDVLNPIRC